ncbi:MAG: A/G-specific adenine glycosylase [Bacteroidetes bacterium]|nr:MAG: A/G-specific adenine glycosylase [Bacteroidota bacterium]TAG88608.1 MAG: A/G-specific adenine glycosylase [Bacteroidota bacterium]
MEAEQKGKYFPTEKLLEWYEKNKRDLPWRNTKNAYHIWLSEVILQQTRVKQGLPYYQKFVQNYPQIENLANAQESEVLRLWQGLGYYSRARNMHKTAQEIVEKLAGKMPDNYKDLLKLKGIGKYTAAAIASFGFDEQVAVLDGNVYRVLSRFFGIETDIASPKAEKEFREIAQNILPKNEKSNQFNQAMMEFGALQCTPQSPDCLFCPLESQCKALEKGKVNELPIKSKKIKIKERFFNYFIFEHQNKIALKVRNKKDIWEGLYDFYLVEHHEILQKKQLESIDLIQNYVNDIQSISKIYTHILTHQKIFISFFHINIDQKEILTQKNYQFFEKNEIENLPKPILLANYYKEFIK